MIVRNKRFQKAAKKVKMLNLRLQYRAYLKTVESRGEVPATYRQWMHFENI